MNITVNILAKNNEETIENTLQSVSSLNAKILIGDLGCKDNTIKICKNYENVQVLPLSLNENISEAKNLMIKNSDTDWVLFVDAWEVMISDPDKIVSLTKEPSAYKINYLQNDLITKEIRFWHKSKNLKFKNPVFETVSGSAKDTEVYFISNPNKSDSIKLELLEIWRKNKPLSVEPIYYLSCIQLSNKDWKKFLNLAELYLHQERIKGMSFTMTQYYCAMVKCYIKAERDYRKAIELILSCIAEKPLMAEFWCLLGDIYYELNQCDKAICFYENALILGSKRLKSDDWPMEISKYKDYPNKMMDTCKKIIDSYKVYGIEKSI